MPSEENRGARIWRDFKASLTRRPGPDQEPETDIQGDGQEEYGLNLGSGDKHYRAWVGPPEDYDTIAALQVSLLLSAGLRETHRLADVGCGSLRAGRMLIPYLRSGNYHGIEPEQWLVEEGIEKELGRAVLEVKRPRFRYVSDFSLEGFGTGFDFVIAQSVFSHTHVDLLRLAFSEIAKTLAPGGKLFATWVEGQREKEGTGWIHKGARQYTWEELERHLNESGMAARRLSWPHPRQSWFVAALPEDEATIEALAGALRDPRPSWIEKRPSRTRKDRGEV